MDNFINNFTLGHFLWNLFTTHIICYGKMVAADISEIKFLVLIPGICLLTYNNR